MEKKLTAITNHEQLNLHVIGVIAASHCERSLR
jgi:hypothetical protein